MATPNRCCLFETPLGACGIAWTPHGIAALQLPEADPRQTLGRVLRRGPGTVESAPPAAVRAAIDAVVALLGGTPTDLRSIVLDETGVPAFHRKVYAAARAIRYGTTATYGDLAARIGEPGAARRVGEGLGRNPFSIVVPCHRVLGAAGAIGGFSARGGTATKRRLLALEHARVGDGPDLFDDAAPDEAAAVPGAGVSGPGDAPAEAMPAAGCTPGADRRHDARAARANRPPASP